MTPATESIPVLIRHGQSLPEALPAWRTPIGRVGDYKPMLAPLPDGRILLCAFRGRDLKQQSADGRKLRHEDIILGETSDGGATWTEPRELCGLLGREPFITVLGTETQRGLAFDLERDVLLIDARTPPGQPSGGGFGNTVPIGNNTFLTAYSYRDHEGAFYAEVARWSLPSGARS